MPVRCGNKSAHHDAPASHDTIAQVRLCFSRPGGVPSIQDEIDDQVGAVEREEFDPDAAYERYLEDGGRHAAQVAWEAAEEERGLDPFAEVARDEARYERTLEDAGRDETLLAEQVEARAGVVPFAEAYAQAVAPEPVYDGVYTVVRPDETHRTFRLRTQAPDAKFAPGKQVIEHLSGADNEGDYTAFGFVADGRVQVWKAHRGNVALLRDAEALLADPSAALVAAHCFRCGRRLTVPASLNQGYGPECAKKVS